MCLFTFVKFFWSQFFFSFTLFNQGFNKTSWIESAKFWLQNLDFKFFCFPIVLQIQWETYLSIYLLFTSFSKWQNKNINYISIGNDNPSLYSFVNLNQYLSYSLCFDNNQKYQLLKWFTFLWTIHQQNSNSRLYSINVS